MLTALVMLATALLAAPALAQGEVQITQAKAQAGGITPGDAAGYPITISRAGSYVLAGNLTASANQIGFQITAPNVTIDLNGFTLDGANVGAIAIFGNSLANTVSVENGTIQRFKQDGIYAATGDYWMMDKVRVINNGRHGIYVRDFLQVMDSMVVANKDRGITGRYSSVIRNNVVTGNGSYGIYAFRATIVGNSITANKAQGIFGADTAGYSQNVLDFNNNGGPQVQTISQMDPNFCDPACP